MPETICTPTSFTSRTVSDSKVGEDRVTTVSGCVVKWVREGNDIVLYMGSNSSNLQEVQRWNF